MYFSCFDLLSFWTWLQLLQIEKIATWKMESPPQSWKFSMVISQHVKYQYLNNTISQHIKIVNYFLKYLDNISYNVLWFWALCVLMYYTKMFSCTRTMRYLNDLNKWCDVIDCRIFQIFCYTPLPFIKSGLFITEELNDLVRQKELFKL